MRNRPPIGKRPALAPIDLVFILPVLLIAAAATMVLVRIGLVAVDSPVSMHQNAWNSRMQDLPTFRKNERYSGGGPPLSLTTDILIDRRQCVICHLEPVPAILNNQAFSFPKQENWFIEQGKFVIRSRSCLIAHSWDHKTMIEWPTPELGWHQEPAFNALVNGNNVRLPGALPAGNDPYLSISYERGNPGKSSPVLTPHAVAGLIDLPKLIAAGIVMDGSASALRAGADTLDQMFTVPTAFGGTFNPYSFQIWLFRNRANPMAFLGRASRGEQ